MVRILVVEDDSRFKEALNLILVSQGYDVKLASNGKLGLQLATMEVFDLILTDIRMPEMNGIELLEAVKKSIKTPVILMTGFSEIKETIEAYELGAAGFLPKPFNKNELATIIQSILPKDKAHTQNTIKNKSQNPDDFCGVSIDDFVSGQNIKYDIFLKLGNNNFVKIANCGDNIPIERIKIYKEKGLSLLYLKKEDFKNYVQFAVRLSQAATKSTIDHAKKVSLSAHAAEVLMEQFFLEGINNANFHNSISIVKNNLDLLSQDEDAKALIDSLNHHSNFLFAHSTGVSLYSVMIAKNLSWVSESTLTKVSIGGLLHDIGKKEMEKELLNKARVHYTPEEIKMYESHPNRGAELLSNVKSIQSDILQIIQQHHERGNGYGFPNRFLTKQIFPLSKVVGLANVFCNLVIKNPNNKGFTPVEALDRINTICRDQFDEEYIIALNKIFNFQ